MTSSNQTTARQALRKCFRKRRLSLDEQQQATAERNICQQLLKQQAFVSAQNIAIYWPDDGEVGTLGIIESAWRMGKKTYLPIIDSQGNMQFVPFTVDDKLVKGQWGLQQPQQKKSFASPLSLDLVLLPLVAFDSAGNRLGRGGGHYDKFLSGLKYSREERHRKPFAMGLGHECQHAANIPAAPWDIPLDAVVTDLRACYFHPSPK